MDSSHLEKTLEHDALLATTVQPIRILAALAWPREAEAVFLAGWRAGRPELPEVHLRPLDYSKEIGILETIQSRCDRGHPLDNLLFKTARSYASAARMLGAIGTPGFTGYSIELYGKPDDVYKTQNWNAVDAADFFLARTDDLQGSYVVPPTVADIPAEVFAQRLQRKIDAFFVDDRVEVVIDPSLPSKAIAMALDGADFIDVFRSFLEAGQSEEESYQSTVRCFRGGDVRGGTVFTKHTVYLKGLMELHAFLAVIIHENRPELANALFAGRLSIGDVIELAPYFESGFLLGPHYMPHWASDLRTLASALACNAFFTRVDLTHVQLNNFILLEEATATGAA